MMMSLEVEALLRIFLITLVFILVVPHYRELSRYLNEWSKVEEFFQGLTVRTSNFFNRLSMKVTKIQTGFLNNNLILYSIGMAVLFLAVFVQV